MMLFAFIIRHLPMILAIFVFAMFIKFSFLKLFIFLYIVGALYETILWQFPACIEIRKPIPSQRSNLEHEIISKKITIKRRFIYFIWKFIHCISDWQYIAGILIVSAIFTIGYSLITK